MGCSGSKKSQTKGGDSARTKGSVDDTPGEISNQPKTNENPPLTQLVIPEGVGENEIGNGNRNENENGNRDGGEQAGTTVVNGKRDKAVKDNDVSPDREYRNPTPTPSVQFKRPSLLTLSNESSLTDITVNIPDPFRANYKVTDSLYHKNYRKLYRGIDKNRYEVLVEFTELRAYSLAGYSQVDFFNRIDIIRDLNHCSIPKVLDIYDGPEVNRVVFDYFPGKDLDCLLKMKGALPPSAIKPFMLALVTIVQYIHSKNIIHRNISPSSIILAAFSSFVSVQQMRVTGLTRPVRVGENELHHSPNTSRDDQQVMDGLMPLKLIDMDAFCAPELSTPHQGFEVDLFSIGGVLYNITTGVPPPVAGILDPTETFSGKIWSDEKIVHWNVQNLIIRLMSVNPNERPGLLEIADSFNR